MKDPVCGMEVADPPKIRTEWQGRTFGFCNPRCLEKFRAEPARYAGAARPEPMPPASSYTCPMHPEVRSSVPGACPKCGMALEPADPSTPEDGGELREMAKRFWVSLFCSAPLLVLGMAEMFTEDPLSPRLSGWFQWILASPVVVWGGAFIFERAAASLARRSLNMFTLIALGVGTAYVYSAAAVLFPQAFPEPLRVHGGLPPLYFESAAAITLLVILGQLLELKARSQTGRAIRALLDLAPPTARRVNADGREEDVPLDRVAAGDRLRVPPGAKIPVDGVVVDGAGPVNESMITGESMPVDRRPGDKVIGGTLNGTGSLVMRAERVGRDTLLAQIVRQVAEAQRSRAPIQRLADRVSGWFVPMVLLTAAATAAAWAAFGPEPRAAYAIANAIAVLIIACPCALGLATPMAVMAGVGRGAAEGILVRSAEALEHFRTVDTLVFDKTGTLTEGRPALRSISAEAGVDENSLLAWAAALERPSEHPLAHAIVEAAENRSAPRLPVEHFEAVPGKGVRGRIGGRPMVLGNSGWLEELGIPASAASARADAMRHEGQTVMFLADEKRILGILGVADPVKATTPEAIRLLRGEGLRLIMATGDNAVTAEAVARGLGIDDVRAGVLPAQKAEIVRELQKQGRRVAVAGDGVNDAPALALAQVGIAMGSGTDVAMHSAAITLVKGDLRGIAKARALSRATMRNIRQNLFFAFAYNLLAVPVAAGALYPVFGVLLSPILASAAMSFSSVSVIANSLRLRRAAL